MIFVCKGKLTLATSTSPSSPFLCSFVDAEKNGTWVFYDPLLPIPPEVYMSQSAKCEGTLIAVVAPNVNAPFRCTGTWVFYETPTITEVSAPEISNILFVLTLCLGFALGFHKGGQR